MADGSHRWPRLSYEDWSDTALTLHLWTQVVGKIRLALTPWLNHSWQVPYYVTARGRWGRTVFANESPTRSVKFDAENGLYSVALTMPLDGRRVKGRPFAPRQRLTLSARARARGPRATGPAIGAWNEGAWPTLA